MVSTPRRPGFHPPDKYTGLYRDEWPWLILLVGLLAAAFTLPAAAQTGPTPITLEVRAGCQIGATSYLRQGERTGIRVRIRNTGPGVEGALEVRTSESKPRTTRRLLRLPSGADQVFWFALPLKINPADVRGAAAEVRWVTGKQVATSVPIIPVGVSSVDHQMILVLGRGVSVSDTAGFRQVRMQQIPARECPTSWSGLLSYQTVSCNGEAWGRLDPDQRRALHLWTQQGGRLLLGTSSPQDFADPIARDLLPVRPRGSEGRSSLSELVGLAGKAMVAANPDGEIPCVVADLVWPAESVAGRAGKPLIAVRPIGLGAVLWCGFDPASQVVRQWPEGERLWLRLLQVLTETGSSGPIPLEKLGDLNPAARLEAPPAWTIGVMGAGYLILFGPGLMWALRQLRRTLVAWLLIPCLSAVLTAGLLSVGGRWGGGRSGVATRGVVLAREGESTAVELGDLAVFSPINRALDLRTDDPGVALLPGPREEMRQLEDRLQYPDLISDDGATWTGIPLQLYSSLRMRFQAPIELGGSVRRANRGPGRPRLSNGTGFRWREAWWIQGARTWRSGRVAAGAMAEFVNGRQEDTRIPAELGPLVDAWKQSGPGAADWLLVARCDRLRPPVTVAGIDVRQDSVLLSVWGSGTP